MAEFQLSSNRPLPTLVGVGPESVGTPSPSGRVVTIRMTKARRLFSAKLVGDILAQPSPVLASIGLNGTDQHERERTLDKNFDRWLQSIVFLIPRRGAGLWTISR
jgi:hypothetical protein